MSIWGCDPLYVHSFVCLSIIFRLIYLVILVFSEAYVLSWWNFTQMTINIWFFKNCVNLRLWPSVRPSIVCLFVNSILRLKLLVKLDFSEADMLSLIEMWNKRKCVHGTQMPRSAVCWMDRQTYKRSDWKKSINKYIHGHLCSMDTFFCYFTAQLSWKL